MESDRKLEFKIVIEYFAIAAIAIEAVFAAFWLFKNLGVIQSDFVAHTYILAAESLKVDDSMGILYAFLVRVFGHGIILQLLQIVAVTASIFCFSLGVFEKGTGLTIALLTAFNPLMLQAETAISPNALVLACVLTVIVSLAGKSVGKGRIAATFVATLAAGFLNPDYAYLFLTAEVIYIVIRLITRKKFEILLLAVCIIAFAAPVVTNNIIRDDYAYGRVHRTVSFLGLQRLAWPRMHDYPDSVKFIANYNLQEDTGEYTDYFGFLKEADKVPENMAMHFAYDFEHMIGAEAARRGYEEMVGITFSKGPGYWAPALVRDEILYLFSPISSAAVLIRHTPDTSVFSGLKLLFNGSPSAFKVYYIFSSVAAFLLTLMYIAKFIGERVFGKKALGSSMAVWLFGIIVLLSLYATLVCVREYDYRNVLFMIVGWPAAAMALTERRVDR